MEKRFTGSFTQQAELPEASMIAAQRILNSAALHRYQAVDGALPEAALLEEEFANWQGSSYCLALASGGQAIQLALRASGVKHGDPVLTNAFTLAPVPGAINAVGGQPVLVEITRDLLIDLDDLTNKIASSGSKVLLLSHMRGHVPDMTKLMSITDQMGVTVVEDCAHTMGATWNDKKSGNFGKFGCFSTQTYKHLNSGEGGFMTTNDPNAAAQAVIMSGSYMNYALNGAAPDASYFEDAKYDSPNMSARMDNLRAAILRPQLAELNTAVQDWKTRALIITRALSRIGNMVYIPQAPKGSERVGSSVQFQVLGQSPQTCKGIIQRLADRGVHVQWFGHEEPHGFTSQHKHWRYMMPQTLPATDAVLSTLFDMRVPRSFSTDDCVLVAEILCDVLQDTLNGRSAA